MDRLPPLNGLRAFEAAGRHRSVTRAAAELNVTPGAISRQISTLEEQLGVQLLDRRQRDIRLTVPGEEYLAVLSRAFTEIRSATRALRDGRRQQLRLRAYTTFAMRWLIPRLASFHEAHPDVNVVLTTSLEPVDFARDELDCAVRLGDGQWKGVEIDRLIPNVLVPVCSPTLARKLKDLERFTLLHAIGRKDDWRAWLACARTGIDMDAQSYATYESSAMAYSAAVEGHGIAMAQYFLVHEDIKAGRLVRPWPQALDMGDYTYYLLRPAQVREARPLRVFRAWLLAECANSVARLPDAPPPDVPPAPHVNPP